MLSSIIIQALKLVMIMENRLPLPLLTAAETPPFGESALSSSLMQLQFRIISSSALQMRNRWIEHMETLAGTLHNELAQVNEYQGDVTEFLDLIESHRPLDAHENELRENMNIIVQSAQELDVFAKSIEKVLAGAKSGKGAKEQNRTVETFGASDVADSFVLMGL